MPGEYNGRIPVTPLPGGRRTCPFCIALDLEGAHGKSCPLAGKGASAVKQSAGPGSGRQCPLIAKSPLQANTAK